MQRLDGMLTWLWRWQLQMVGPMADGIGALMKQQT
jgi:hypothetical protein